MKENNAVIPHVTITLEEYDRLLSLANANEKQIEERSLEHYKKYGVCAIRVEACIRERRGVINDVVEKFEFECIPSGIFVAPSDFSRVGKQFAVSSETEQRIKEFVSDYVSTIFRRRFGLHLMALNAALRYKCRTKFFMSLAWVLTITGWFVAFFLFMANYGN